MFGASSYHSYTSAPHQSFVSNSYGQRSFVPHATQFHTQPPAPATFNRPAAPLNRYIPDATIRTVNDNRIVDAHTALKPGMVVEVTRPGHQTELEYANYNGRLTPLNESVLNHHVPNEIKQEVNRLGGPSYFAHDLHNRMETAGFMSQFKAGSFHGPNRPLI
jgi:hypothetical protein